MLRVFSRLYNDPGVITDPKVKKAFTARVMEHQPPEKAGDYNQALMELGALVCVPNGAPLCDVCPLAGLCQARAAGTTAVLPQKAKPKPRKVLPVTVALVESPAGFLVQQRPAKGLLAGLWQPLLWESEHLLQAEVLARLAALGVDTGTAVPEALPAAKHIFSHIEWLLSGVALTVPEQAAPACRLGQPRGAAHHLHPARCLCRLQGPNAGMIWKFWQSAQSFLYRMDRKRKSCPQRL